MRRTNFGDMTVQEQIEAVKEKICEDYCKYTEEYRSLNEDPDEADKKRIADKCHFCLMARL